MAKITLAEKARAEVNKLKTKDIGGAFSSLLPKKFSSNQHANSELAEAFSKWVYICVKKNAHSVATQTLQLIATDTGNIAQKHKSININKFKHHTSLMSQRKIKQATNYVEIVEHPFLQLLEKPSKGETQYTLIYAMTVNLELFGTAYLRIQKDSQLQIPINIECLHTQFVTYKLNNYTNEVEKYYYGFGTQRIEIPVEEIIVIKYYSPYSDVVGFAPLQAVFDSYKLDSSFDTYQLAVNENSGNPSMIMQYNGKALKKNEQEELEASWNRTTQGLANTGRMKVIGGDFTAIKTGLTPKELDFVQGRTVTLKAIANAFDIPMPLVDANESIMNNLKASLYQYQVLGIEPKIKQIVDEFNIKILPYYDEDRIYLTYADPVEQRHTDIVDNTIKLFEKNIITLEEARDAIFNS